MMTLFSFQPELKKTDSYDLLVVPYWEGGVAAGKSDFLKERLSSALSSGDFRGKSNETLLIYDDHRILLLGLGLQSSETKETLRRAYANAARSMQSKKIENLHVILPKCAKLKDDEVLRAVSEGLLLANYAFLSLKSESLKDSPVTLLKKIVFIAEPNLPLLNKLSTIAKGVYLVRDLVNSNADDITPKALAQVALSMESVTPGLKATILDKKQIEKEKMGLLLAVNRGSTSEPYLINLSYQGNPKSKDHVVLVGKGITYDTGGLALKPADGMLTMKCDMSGAAIVIATVQTAALLNLPINVTAVAPLTENAIGPNAYKNGDVYRSMNGKTVEINNTDAEGRLILADALTYAIRHHHPTVMIDLATLTGAISIALGEDIAGLFTNHAELRGALEKASESTGEKIWELPLNPDYKEVLKSDIADLVNSGTRQGSSITASLFLQEFTESVPWAHLDIAGSAFLSKPKYYYSTRATGFGVRLLIEFLENRLS